MLAEHGVNTVSRGLSQVHRLVRLPDNLERLSGHQK